MEPWMVIAVGAAFVAAVVAIATLIMRSKQRRRSAKLTAHLRQHFGSDYATAVGERGRSDSETGLLEHEQAAGRVPVRALATNEVLRYTESWTAAQERFVDDPGAAPTAADPYLLGRGLGPKQHR